MKKTTKIQIEYEPSNSVIQNYKKQFKQNRLEISGITIFFPHIPYKNQIEYMKMIIQSLKEKKYASLESPTGTGKTLCLLCTIIAWMNQNNFKGKFFYATRTHSQISNIIQELNKTKYTPNVSILSSRKYSCINHGLKKEFPYQLNDKCAIIHEQCIFYKKIKNREISHSKMNDLNIEEICILGQKQDFCPYYYEIYKYNHSSLILLPYNYILNRWIRNRLKINIKNNIIVFDEAHNVPSFLEDLKSAKINDEDIDVIIDICQWIYENKEIIEIEKNHDDDDSENYETDFDNFSNDSNKNVLIITRGEILQEINYLKQLKVKIENIPIGDNQFQWLKNGHKFSFEKFLKLFLDENDSEIEFINERGEFYININQFINQQSKNLNNLFIEIEKKIGKKSKGINYKISKIFQKLIYFYERLNDLFFLYGTSKEKNLEKISSYEFIATRNPNYNIQKKNPYNPIEIKILCLNPGEVFLDILNQHPHNIIFTSGTLNPLWGIESQLQIKIPISFENQHIIPGENIYFSIISCGEYNNKKIAYQFTYKERNNISMILSLGYTIIDLIQNVKKGGVLVFFPSFEFLNLCLNKWIPAKINEKISKIKKLIIDKVKEKNCINQYKENINSILFSVYRGSSSEGIDFSDDYARMVICIGIPYASFYDEKVNLKKLYLDKINCLNPSSKKFRTMNGKEWYHNDAVLAVNQSLGRVIRHYKDYGAMICIDSRYESFISGNYFSKWIRDKVDFQNVVKVNNDFSDLKNFYLKMEENSLKNNNNNNNYNEEVIKIDEDDNDYIIKKRITYMDNWLKNYYIGQQRERIEEKDK